MALDAYEASSQYLVLHAVVEANPERAGAAAWSGPQLAKRCAELCGKPCTRESIAMTMRRKLQPKGLVTSRKESHTQLLWEATAKVRALAL